MGSNAQPAKHKEETPAIVPKTGALSRVRGGLLTLPLRWLCAATGGSLQSCRTSEQACWRQEHLREKPQFSSSLWCAGRTEHPRLTRMIFPGKLEIQISQAKGTADL